MKKSAARVLAKLQGEKFYAPEQPCKKGHVIRRTSTGSCIICAKENEQLRIAANRETYNLRKRKERISKLPELAAKARLIRKNETEKQRAIRLEKARLKQQEWRKNNSGHEGSKLSKQKYKRNNPAKTRADTVKRRLAKINRTPKWLTVDDHWMIEQAYELAALRTKMFGFSWHVDHTIPLQGRFVCGLHTPYNLQVIPGVENVKKANQYLPA